jgi:predicted Abi (CAAX) family protease
LLPRPGAGNLRGIDLVLAAVSLSAFVLWHPLNGVLFRKSARRLFTRVDFLLAAAALGLVCTLAYWISRSLWPPVLMHWLTVSGWFMFFGGQRDLAGRDAS